MKNLAIFTVLNYPNSSEFFKILDCLEEAKVGYVEIGIPVEDPYVDGSLIQEAHKAVLGNGLSRIIIEETLKKVKERYSFKVILMTYQSGVSNYSLTTLNHELYDGIICVDDELDSVDFNQPIAIYNESLSTETITRHLSHPSLFNYVMSGRGKTGTFNEVPTEYKVTLKRIKEIQPKALNFVGFGIKTQEDIDEVKGNGADGAIIGTEFLKIYLATGIIGIKEYLNQFM